MVIRCLHQIDLLKGFLCISYHFFARLTTDFLGLETGIANTSENKKLSLPFSKSDILLQNLNSVLIAKNRVKL